MNVIKALCFFYYLLILPFIWLGKKIWWGLFADTVDKKKAAESAAVKAAHRKKGPEELEKLGVVSLRKEMEKYRSEFENKEKEEQERARQRKEKEKARQDEARREMWRELESGRVLQYSSSNQGPVSLRAEVERYQYHTEGDEMSSGEGVGGWLERDSKQEFEVPVDLEFYDDDLWAGHEHNLLDSRLSAIDHSGQNLDKWAQARDRVERKPRTPKRKRDRAKDEDYRDKKPKKKAKLAKDEDYRDKKATG